MHILSDLRVMQADSGREGCVAAGRGLHPGSLGGRLHARALAQLRWRIHTARGPRVAVRRL